MDTTLEGDDSELDDEEFNDEISESPNSKRPSESPDTKGDVKRPMREDEKLVRTLQFRSTPRDEFSFKFF